MTSWEYEIKSVRFGEWDLMKEDLNELGIDGWELVKLSGDVDEQGMIKAFLKRPLDILET
ncbi:MAG: hypothetical protein PWR29_1256 [Methanolobus sp.]|jgi:hypothetical protein|uniref:DUF4177 domain-containing protein n=1 Tax=Methanolobus chelungpuianus TaxID=502115 RepID=A0AAE3KYC1_9EURY|nr:hypothetical protein [Methanolobus chelungpuianus]MDI3539707.1 hypothetical protein [Methanolobus sp.]MCQ6963636.1 hypothetical protein [Methanolobus chelungpuianus]MDK2833468.1 hypothetical protein [Methanolobus sp.]MDK2912299.1 hypothetical protein [Methanolobus sp.]MDN5310689.1 hypothetical protein [Methanolobus sp.]